MKSCLTTKIASTEAAAATTKKKTSKEKETKKSQPIYIQGENLCVYICMITIQQQQKYLWP